MLPENRPVQLSLLQFLKQARNLHAQHVAGTTSAPIYVLGNPSADLDSIISAIIYSYFASGSSRIPAQQQPQQQQQGARQYIPLINLHDVPSGSELRRLRPEFATALWLSTNPAVPSNDGDVAGWVNDAHSAANVLRDHALTVADVKAHLRWQNTTSWSFETIMVDWNALPVGSKERPGHGSLDTLPGVEIDVVGCIDHHVDEAFVPPAPVQDHPRLIQPGPGSCTSLVVRELRSRGLWPEETATASTSTHEDETGRAAIYEAQAAKLALAAILIDTTNLTAEGKVTEVDRTAVAFLEAKVQRGYETQQRSLLKHRHPQPHRQQLPVPTPGGDPALEWNRANFFATVQRTKHESLDFLTLDEILGRDYKDWIEAPASAADTGKTLRVGICSVVQPVSYLVAKAGGVMASGASSGAKAREFLTDLRNFSRDRELDVVAVMTAFTSPPGEDGEFRRELLVWAVNEADSTAVSGTKRFADRAVRELGLEEWDGAPESVDIRAELNGEKGGWKRVWRQTDVTKSRKQVAPLLRAALAE